MGVSFCLAGGASGPSGFRHLQLSKIVRIDLKNENIQITYQTFDTVRAASIRRVGAFSGTERLGITLVHSRA